MSDEKIIITKLNILLCVTFYTWCAGVKRKKNKLVKTSNFIPNKSGSLLLFFFLLDILLLLTVMIVTEIIVPFLSVDGHPC